MQTLQQGYRGMSLLVQINADRLFSMGALAAALLAGAYFGSY